jgi:hypothetical protein
MHHRESRRCPPGDGFRAFSPSVGNFAKIPVATTIATGDVFLFCIFLTQI